MLIFFSQKRSEQTRNLKTYCLKPFKFSSWGPTFLRSYPTNMAVIHKTGPYLFTSRKHFPGDFQANHSGLRGPYYQLNRRKILRHFLIFYGFLAVRILEL